MTNTKNDATTLTVPVVKIWDGGAPSDIKEVTVNITRSVVKNGETLADPSFTQQSTLLNDGNGWRSEFTNLPVADKDGNKYIYDVKEVVPTGYTERYEGGFKCGVVIYNTPSQGDLIINKINPSGEKLVGVDFTLTGITDTTFANTVTSDANGVIIFADLPSGDYELKETKTLPGYGLDKTVRKVHVTDNGVVTVDGRGVPIDLVNVRVEMPIIDLTVNDKKYVTVASLNEPFVYEVSAALPESLTNMDMFELTDKLHEVVRALDGYGSLLVVLLVLGVGIVVVDQRRRKK